VTEQCLLSPTRNPSLDRAGIEHYLKVRLSLCLSACLPAVQTF